jgi:A/G-specific adenine glycosylase
MASLAAAPLDEVLAAWSGLGYYRRARSLHEGAKFVLREHGGEFPRRIEDALRIPGVGIYTAGAVLSIAYNLPVPAVDGNVERVVTRLLRSRGDPKQAARARELRAVVAGWIPKNSASRFNQAIMELGATVCTPRAAACDRCPLSSICLARRHSDIARYPESPKARKTVAATLHAAVLASGEHYLLERVSRGSFLHGLWLFPFVEAPFSLQQPVFLHRTLERKLRVKCSLVRPLGRVRHSITYRRITVESFLFKPESPLSLKGKKNLRWARLDDLGRTVAVSSLVFKIAKRLQ